MKNEDREVLRMMEKHGGSFIQALSQLGWRADESNLEKIKRTWPHEWSHYWAMASQAKNQVAAAIIENHPMSEYQKDE